MGVQKVKFEKNTNEMQQFMWHLLRDVEALEHMLNHDMFETDTIRIGAEQEMCLVDKDTFKPALIAMEVLKTTKKWDWLGTELALFNLETNMSPQVFEGKCLSAMEKETRTQLNLIREKLKPHNARIILTGILPTLRKFDLDMKNLTPKPRYKALMEAINANLQGLAYELRLTGIDELLIKHDSPLLEACNTSFQVHLQVKPREFVKMYNIAQTLAGPIVSIAANSPIVFGKRLWHETRIALFQQSLDTRTSQEHMRERSPRVSFGKGWLHQSILEIYKEDITRFRVLLSDKIEEDALSMLASNKIPKLKALQIHNSTVYRWNRPCYGISDNGQPHLRIECRVLPSGPSVLDEIANAAFWLGCMTGMALRYADIRDHISFENVRDNFEKAAIFGLDSKFTWFDDEKITAESLIQNHLIPIAREGLAARQVDPDDINRYMDVIEGRCQKHTTGARWQLRAFSALKEKVTADEATAVMTAAIVKNQEQEKPVHTWRLPTLKDLDEYRPDTLKVEEFMVTDLYTVQKEDIVELVAQMMDWNRIRYMPVEDEENRLVGLITSRLLLRHFSQQQLTDNKKKNSAVHEIMIPAPVTVTPDASILSAMETMQEKKIGCLPVVKDHTSNELVGIITEMDFLRITSRLLLRKEGEKQV